VVVTAPDRDATGATASSSAQRFAHLRPLDGLRGVAVLAVVLYHFSSSVAPGGFLGVDVFFVLSGFLITSLLVTEYGGTGRISLGSFWLRRARRLLPALLLVLVVVGVYALFFEDQVEGQKLGVDGLAALGYFANWHFIASNQSYIEQFINRQSLLRHTWSLSIEEQFYLVWPLVVGGLGLLVARAGGHGRAGGDRSLRRLVVVTSLLIGAGSLIAMIALYAGADPSRVYYATDTHVHGLALGAALGALVAGVPAVSNRSVGAALKVAGSVAAAALVVAFASLSITSAWLYEGGYGLVALAVVLVIAGAAQAGWNPLQRLLGWRGLVGLGLISYGIYLWHWPISLWFDEDTTGLSGVWLFAVRVALTLAISIASYRLLEMPIRRHGLPRLGGLKPVVIAAGAVAGVFVLLVVPALTFPTTTAAPAAAATASRAETVTQAYARAPKCDGSPRDLPDLSQGGRPLRILAVGNSYLGEAISCLRRLLGPHGASISVVPGVGFTACQPSVIRAVRAAAADPARRPDLALFFSFPGHLGPGVDPAQLDPRLATPDQLACIPPARQASALRRLVSIWRASGTFVALVLNPPQAGHVSDHLDHSNPTYERLAREDPQHVGVLDAGRFLHDDTGKYPWRLPCLPGGERGCTSRGDVVVRFPTDNGFHFCADPTWLGGKVCRPEFAAGERRLGAALVQQLIARYGDRSRASSAAERSSGS
jgi:peptidoglycan/LPS O-acetylase OafA/YrhL